MILGLKALAASGGCECGAGSGGGECGGRGEGYLSAADERIIHNQW